MAFQWMRRTLLGLASASLLLLGACGSGTIESQLQPNRVIVFGDALNDVGQTGASYTVNDGSATPVWTQFVAASYHAPLAPAASGGFGYATGNARVVARPDAAGNSATPTIQQQIDTFLATNTFNDNDLVIIDGGFSDVIAEMAAFRAGTQTSAQMLANVTQAAHDLAAQAKRLVAAGSIHVVVVGPYDLGKTPWAGGIGQQGLLSSATSTFNNTLLIDIVDQGKNMLYVDAALLYNTMISNPAAYTLTNVTDTVCNSVDTGPGIGIGAGQVNSKLCTTATVVNATYNGYVFADAVYPTPGAHAHFGDFAFSKIHSRW
jgi:phospholipase/lecithinase/hemolysin